jgi:hypothetical protein
MTRAVTSQNPDKQTAGITVFLVLMALFPVIAALAILYRQAPSVPYQDDYGAILEFASDYEQLNSWKEKLLDIATRQSNEYKLGFEHSIVASELELTHHLNFGFLMALGNLFLLPIAWLLWLTYADDKAEAGRRLLQFLPISFLFFSLTYWENLDWTMTGLQNTPVILFSLLAIYLLCRRAHPLWACFAAMLACFTSANGFLLGPVGLMILLPRRAYATTIAWCASFVPPLAAYLYHYRAPVPVVMHPLFYITRPLFFCAVLGCAIPFRWLAVLLGVVLLAIFSLAIRSRFDRSNPAGFYFGVWIVATSALVAWVRGVIGVYIASRYSLYSILMLICCYSFLARYLPERFPGFERRFYFTSLVVAIIIFVSANLDAYQKLQARRRMILTGIELYRANPEVNSPMIDPLVEVTVPREKALEQAILTRSIQNHIYTLPPKEEIQ